MKYIVLAIGLLVSINGFAENESSVPSAHEHKLVQIRLKTHLIQCAERCNTKCDGPENVQSMNYSAANDKTTAAPGAAETMSDSHSVLPSCVCGCK